MPKRAKGINGIALCSVIHIEELIENIEEFQQNIGNYWIWKEVLESESCNDACTKFMNFLIKNQRDNIFKVKQISRKRLSKNGQRQKKRNVV